MKMISNRVLVQRVKAERANTDGVIILPPICMDDNNTGGPKVYRVLAVGPGRRNRRGETLPVEFSPGDRVLCQSYFTGATELKDGTFIITDDMVIAVLPK